MVKISKALYEAHRELSNSSAAFLEYVKENPGSLDRFDFDAYHPGNWFLDHIRFQAHLFQDKAEQFPVLVTVVDHQHPQPRLRRHSGSSATRERFA